MSFEILLLITKAIILHGKLLSFYTFDLSSCHRLISEYYFLFPLKPLLKIRFFGLKIRDRKVCFISLALDSAHNRTLCLSALRQWNFPFQKTEHF